MVSSNFNNSYDSISKIISKFQADESFYLSPKYQESEVRQDFIDKFWDALGWDVYHQKNLNPYEREVRIEKSVMVDGRGKRADYAFFNAPDFAQVKFLAEAKKPSRNLENTQDCFQAIRYGWNPNTPIAVLTDFQQFLILDSRYKPNVETAFNSVVKKFHYIEFSDEETFSEIYFLFSREAVAENSLEKYAQTLGKFKGARQAKLFNASVIQPIDAVFLKELDAQRVSLVGAFKDRNESLSSEALTEITQRTLDRLVFLRFLEDKLVEFEPVIDKLGARSGSAWRDFIAEMPRLNKIYDGTLFKPHALLDNQNFAPNEDAFAQTRDWLAHTNSPYDFNTIPIHILGNIYERFLGKTIETVGNRAIVVEKPEIRKAGGVYYTPEYIVRYIVENTVGDLIKGKTPEQITEMRFADIACGSGSFLLGMFDYLIAHHVKFYNANKKRREQAIKQGVARETNDGNLQLTIHFKREILLNNIYGVDLDAQAVEVAQLSLYLKLLEEETIVTKQQYLTGYREQLLPGLDKNIVYGNSLIDYDITQGMLFETHELKALNPMNFQSTFPEVFGRGGFDAIVGNPPYVRQELFSDRKSYLQKKYEVYHGIADLYVYFFERYISLLKDGGEFGIIVANKWLRANYGEPLRRWVKHFDIQEVIDFGDLPVFQGATTYPCVIRVRKDKAAESFRATEIKSLDFTEKSLPETITENAFSVSKAHLEDKGWSLTDESVQNLLNKLRGKGIPLGEYVNGKVYYGIKTGLNEAFVINAETKTRLVAEDARSAEIIKPFLIGRGVKRYETPRAEKFLILMPKGWMRKRMSKDGTEKNLVKGATLHSTESAFSWLLSAYAAIAEHLAPFAEAAEKRCDKGEFWWELRACDYYDEFEKPKLIYPNICKQPEFAFEQNYNYANQKCFIISSEDKFLLAILNSSISFFLFRKILPKLRGDFYEPSYVYFKTFPIRRINFNDSSERVKHDQTVELVEKMLQDKSHLSEAETDSDKAFYER